MHEQDLDAAIAAHAARIAPGGRLICEFYYLGALIEGSPLTPFGTVISATCRWWLPAACLPRMDW